MKTSLNVLCYTSKTLSNGEHPIMICVNQNRKRKYSSLGISIQAKFWDFEKGKPKPNCPNRIQIEQLILKKTKEVMDKIARLEAENKEYSATSILGNEKVKKYLTVQELFSEYIEQLKQENRIGYSLSVKQVLNSLIEFTHGTIHFEVTKFLNYTKKQPNVLLQKKKFIELSIMKFHPKSFINVWLLIYSLSLI